MPALLRTWATAFVGLLLLQAVWLLVTPPFQGMDEHAHVFKAAAVAHGDWSGVHSAADDGNGELVAVPRDIVEAARPACKALAYTFRDDCDPTAELADGRVLINSAAARYNPVFYAVVGTVAEPFHGIAAGYAMRVATAVWCAALLALALAITRRTARSAWPVVAFVAGCTPTVIYSTSIAAPNGPEMAAGVLLWSTLLFGATERRPPPRWVVTAGTVAAIHLAVLRSLGPLWLALILATAALAIGIPSFLRAARDRRFRLPISAVGLAIVAGVVWTVTSGTNNPSSERGPDLTSSPWPKMFSNWVAWLLQQAAAVPNRNVSAPLIVYGLVLAVWTVLLVLAIRAAPGRVRLAIPAIFAIVTVLAVTISVLSYARLGHAWQGRYAWPYVTGWLALSGRVLDRAPQRVPHSRAALLVTGAALAIATGVTAFDVLDIFSLLSAHSPYVGHGWSPPDPLLVCALIAAGFGALAIPLARPLAAPSRADSSVCLRTTAGAS